MSTEEIKAKTKAILEENGVTKAALFGSAAKGTDTTESDVDILVDLPKGKSLLDFVHLKLELEEVLGKKVDLVEYEAIKPALRNSILQHQVPLL